ncbi:MAG: TonB-dependent receptor [Myxococcales bacterium]|nr:TonB-dependent receptor [Myxococcales bacterium]
MLDRRTILLTIGALLALATARARAQIKLGTVEVEAEREVEEGPEVDAPAAVTVIDARRPSARVSSVADLIEREAGVQVRSTGGLGAFTSVSIRGSDPTQVAVFLDGVPLQHAASAVVDLSQLPVGGLERIEIYRGVPPLELSSQAIGGAIHLVSRRGRPGAHLRAAIGGGSFGARSASVGYASGGRLSVDASAAYHGARGDFTYYDYSGTLIDHTDDHPASRRNNAFDQVALDVTLGSALARRGRVSIGSHGFLKIQGVPGRGTDGAGSRDARLSTGRLILDGSVEQPGILGPAIDLRIDAHLVYGRTLFSNARGEPVGSYLPASTDSATIAAGLRGRLQAAVGAHELWTLFASAEVEHFRPDDLLYPRGNPAPSTRVRAALAVGDDVRLLHDRLALTPALRLDAALSHLSPGLDVRGQQESGANSASAFASPRLGARYRATSWLTVRGSAGYLQRLPTAIELFGDGAFILPRPSLRPETALSGDLGARLEFAPRSPTLSATRVTLEGNLFSRQISDYIALVPSSHALAAQNLPGEVRFLGVEAIARLRVATWLTASLDYTFLHTLAAGGDLAANTDGKELPGVPRHRVGGRVQLAGGPFSCFYEALRTGDVWRDPQNSDGNFIPARTLHALGAAAGPFGRLPLTLTVEVRNLADLRVVDLPLGGLIHVGETTPYPLVDRYDYPLPGRALYATLALQN